MTPEDILRAVGEVDGDLIARASKKTPNPFWRWSGIAAMLVLMIGIVYVVSQQGNLTKPTPEVPVIDIPATDAPATEETPTEGTPALPLNDYQIAFLSGGFGYVGENEHTWQAILSHAERFGIEDAVYYSPETQDTVGYCAVIKEAIRWGANVIFTNGYGYGPALVEMAQQYPDVIFIAFALDDSSQLIDFEADFPFVENSLDNVLVVEFQSEIAGYLAGYSAVKEGYSSLGCYTTTFVDETLNYVNGFAQGAQAAAQELDRTEEICIRLAGEGHLFVDASEYRTEKMNAWVKLGTQLITTYGDGTFIYDAVYAGAELAIAVGNLGTNAFSTAAGQIYLHPDMDAAIKMILRQLSVGDLFGGHTISLPYYEFIGAEYEFIGSDYALSLDEKYENLYHELLDGTRECIADGTFVPENYEIEIIWEK